MSSPPSVKAGARAKIVIARPKTPIPAFTPKMRAAAEAAAKKPDKTYRAYPRIKD